MDFINSSNKINTVPTVSDKPSVEKDRSAKLNPISPHSGNLAVNSQ